MGICEAGSDALRGAAGGGGAPDAGRPGALRAAGPLQQHLGVRQPALEPGPAAAQRRRSTRRPLHAQLQAPGMPHPVLHQLSHSSHATCYGGSDPSFPSVFSCRTLVEACHASVRNCCPGGLRWSSGTLTAGPPMLIHEQAQAAAVAEEAAPSDDQRPLAAKLCRLSTTI